MYPANIEFGKQLREYRESRNISQIELGKIISYSQAEMSKIENGKIDITINQYLQIVETIEVSIYIYYLSLQTTIFVSLIFKHKIV
jgi:Predicted transcriptional regulator with C-terminal CBS domains